MKLTLLCNAGLALEADGQMLLVDLPNEHFQPFYRLPDETWNRILNREPPYDEVVGFYFTHVHPDHCDLRRLQMYRDRWPEVPVFLPKEHLTKGQVKMGHFQMEFQRMDHAPIPDAPVHVVTIVRGGGKSVYLAADAKLDSDAHRQFVHNEKMDCAIWNSMFLSRPETRQLMKETAEHNLIVHMPQERPDQYGLWKKLEHTLKRYPEVLAYAEILDHYPSEVII